MAHAFHFSFTDFLSIQRVAPPSTKKSYLRAVSQLSTFHNHQNPAELTNDQIQDYLLFSIQEKKLSWSSCNVLFCGLKKYYQEFQGRKIKDFSIPPRTRCKKNSHAVEQKRGYRDITGHCQPETPGITGNGIRFRTSCQ